MRTTNQTHEATIRASFYQFLGALTSVSSNKEQVIGIILEEVVKVSAANPDIIEEGFDKTMVLPVLKAAKYILTIEYNKLKADAEKVFGKRIPESVQLGMKEKLALIESLDKQIQTIK